MKKHTFILLALLSAYTFYSCGKAITDAQSNAAPDPANSLSARSGTGHKLAPAVVSNLSAYITYSPDATHIYVTVVWNGTLVVDNVTILVTADMATIANEALGRMTPNASINKTYLTSSPMYNGEVLTVVANASDGSNATATSTVQLSSGGTPPGISIPGMSSPPKLINWETAVGNFPSVYYNVSSALTWGVTSLPQSSPYYNQKIYACIQYSYPNGAAYHYCVTNNVSLLYSDFVRNGFLNFPTFVNYPDGGSNPPCSMPQQVGYYWEAKPFNPDTVRGDRFIRIPFSFN